MERRVHIRRFTAILLVGILLLANMPVYAQDNNQTGPVTVTIYHTNDMHGALAGSDSSIGVDKVAALKDATEHAILVDAGDATQGLPLASLSKGQDIIDIMNAAGYDLMAAGNHEFDYGSAQLLANANRADFPILAANVYNKNNGSLFLKGTGINKDNTGCHKVIDIGGVQIGFFGLTTGETKTATNPAGIADVEFRDEIETAKREIDELKAEGADAIIAVAHLGEQANVPCDSGKLADAMTGNYQGALDVIIDGHSHSVEEAKIVNDVLIQQTGTGLANLGKIEFAVSDGGTVSAVNGSMLAYGDVTIAPKKEVTDKINTIKGEQDKTMSKRLCDVKGTFWGGTVNHVKVARITETNLGNFTADAYQSAAKSFMEHASGMDRYQGVPILAVQNGGGIRASLEEGEMTLGDLVTVFPFSNTLMIKEVTPKIVYEMLEQSVSLITGLDEKTGQLLGEPNGGFLQVGGFSFIYNPSAPKDSKVESVQIMSATGGGAQQVDRNDESTRLLLVSNNFIMNGGNGYDMLTNASLVGEIGGELENMEKYINSLTQNGQLPLEAGISEGRIQVNTDSSRKNYYEACIQVLETGQQGSPAAGKPVSLYIDGSKVPVSKTADAQGMVTAYLPYGEHEIRLSGDMNEKPVTVNNYIGWGVDTGDAASLLKAAYVKPAGQIEITVPSIQESTIAPDRSFYVRGKFDGIPFEPGKDYRVDVSVYALGESPEAGNTPMRTVSSDKKGKKTLKTEEITYPDANEKDFSDCGMPELIWDGNTDESFQNGSIKCSFDEKNFVAMIAGGKPDASNPADYVDDQMEWVDSNSNPYQSLPEGVYHVRVTVNDANAAPGAQAAASVEQQIVIGSTADKVLARFSPEASKNRAAEFAKTNGYRIYLDPFPGYWTDADGNWLCEIGHEWRAADATEYLTGNVHFIIYNIKESSTSYSVELGAMQERKAIDTRLYNYYYSTGEPEPLGGNASDIVAFASGDKLQFARAEMKSAKDKDGVYEQDNPGKLTYDMNVNDGIEASAGEYISLYGVTAPIQIDEKDIIRNTYPAGSRYTYDNTYTLKNKIQTVKYHITGQGVDVTYEKEVKLNRITGGKDNYSELEFKHVLPVTADMANKTLTVATEGYDAHGQLVGGTGETFEIRVGAEKPADKPGDAGKDDPADKTGDKGKADKNTKSGTAPLTGDGQSALLLIALMAISAGIISRRKKSA